MKSFASLVPQVRRVHEAFEWRNNPLRPAAVGRASELRANLTAFHAASEDMLKQLVTLQMHEDFAGHVTRAAVDEAFSQPAMPPLLMRQHTEQTDWEFDIPGLEMWNDRANWDSNAVSKNRMLVYRLVHRVIVQHEIYRELLKYKLSDPNVTIFVQRPEQSGKTNTCILLAWLSNLCYGQAAYVLLRSGTAASEDYYKFENPVTELNKRIWKHMVGFSYSTGSDGKETYTQLSGPSFERRLQCDSILTTDDSARKGFMQPYILHSHHLHTGDKKLEQAASQEVLKNKYPMLYKRLTTAQNVEKAVLNEMSTMIKAYGVDEYGFAKMTLLIDEYQMSTKQGTKVHGAVHESLGRMDGLKDALAGAIQMPFVAGVSQQEREDAQHQEIERRFSRWEQETDSDRASLSHFSACIRGQVRISATTVSGQVTFEEYEMRESRLLELPVPAEYYGDAGSKGIVDGKAISFDWSSGSELEFLEATDFPALYVPSRLQKFCLSEFRKELERDGFSHTLMQGISSGNNANLFQWAKFLIDFANSEMPERAVVAVTAYMYTTAGNLPGGPWLVFSDAALPMREQIAGIAERLFISVDKKAGVLGPGKVGEQIALHKGAELAPGIRELMLRYQRRQSLANCLQMPKNGQLYLPKLLQLVDKAAELCGISPSNLNVVTIGNGMLKVGMTPKTDDHRMGVTLGLISATERQIKNQSGEDLSQGLAGRIAGPRTGDPYWNARGNDDSPRIVTSGSLKARIQGARKIQQGTVQAAASQTQILNFDYKGLGGRDVSDLAVQFISATPAMKRTLQRYEGYEDPAKKVVRDAIANSTAGDIGKLPPGFRTAEDEKKYQQVLNEMYEAVNAWTSDTPAAGRMPKIGQVIYVAHNPSIDAAYPWKVISLQWNPDYNEEEFDQASFPVIYTLRCLVNEEFDEVADGEVTTFELDQDMDEWHDQKPQSTMNQEEAARQRRESSVS